MSVAEPEPASPDRPFLFSLRTVLLVFVVLALSMAVFGAWGGFVFALAVGLAAYIERARSYGCGVALVLGLVSLFALCSGVFTLREAGRQFDCRSNLNQIAWALQEYHRANGHFPPAYTVDKSGKPLLSWRVLILPYTEYGSLYKAYNLNEAWNGPTNKPLSKTPVSAFICESDRNTVESGAGQMNYLAVVGSGAAWTGDKPRSIDDFHGAAASTIMLVDVANSGISLGEPRDLSIDALGAADEKSSAIVPSSNHRAYTKSFFYCEDDCPVANVAMADYSTFSLCLGGLSRDELRKVFQIGGCGPEVVSKLSQSPTLHWNWPNIAALAVWLLSVAALLTVAVRSRKKVPASPVPSAG